MSMAEISMENLYAGSADKQIVESVNAVNELGQQFNNGLVEAHDATIELNLFPDFMRMPGGAVADLDAATKIAEETLAGLRNPEKNHNWHTFSEKLSYKVNDTTTETYWEFVDSEFNTWVVTEVHNTQPLPRTVGVRVYVDKNRPLDYQNLLDAIKPDAAIQEDPAPDAKLAAQPKHEAEPKSTSRIRKIGDALTQFSREMRYGDNPRHRRF